MHVVVILIYDLFIIYNIPLNYNRYIYIKIMQGRRLNCILSAYHCITVNHSHVFSPYSFSSLSSSSSYSTLSFPWIAEKSLADDDSATASFKKTAIATYIHFLYIYDRRRSHAYGSIVLFQWDNKRTHRHIYIFIHRIHT